MAVIHYRFLVRGGTAAALAALNEVPLSRELCFEVDTGKGKLGNGATAWNDLPYLPGGSGGSAWLSGSAAPGPLLGNDGDHYLRTSNGDVYEKAAGAWSVIANIIGPPGAPGAPGDPGPPGDDGEDGRAVELQVAGGFMQWRLVGDPTWANLVAMSTLKGDPGPAGPSSTTFPTASFDGGLSAIQVGSSCELYVPFGFEISKANLVGKPVGTLQVDVRVTPLSGVPAVVGDSICASARPTLSGGYYYQDDTLTGWDTTIPASSVIQFIVTACAGVKTATLVLEGERT